MLVIDLIPVFDGLFLLGYRQRKILLNQFERIHFYAETLIKY